MHFRPVDLKHDFQRISETVSNDLIVCNRLNFVKLERTAVLIVVGQLSSWKEPSNVPTIRVSKVGSAISFDYIQQSWSITFAIISVILRGPLYTCVEFPDSGIPRPLDLLGVRDIGEGMKMVCARLLNKQSFSERLAF